MHANGSDLDELAAKIHAESVIIDGHCDILMPIADGKMRLKDRVDVPPPEDWHPPVGWNLSSEAALYNFTPHTDYFQTMGQYDIPRFLAGGLTCQGCAIYIDEVNLNRSLERALDMIYWLNREAEECESFKLVRSANDIRRVKMEGKTSGFLSLEGFEPFGANLKLLDVFFGLGLRMASLTHSRRNAFADGFQRGVNTGGLSQLGRKAIKRMNERGIVIDLGHLNQPGCWEVLGLSGQPVVWSHTAPRHYFPERPEESPLYGDLVLPDARKLLDELARNGGVMGVIGFGQADLNSFLDDIDYIANAIGVDHVGIGTDFFGFDQAPSGFQTMEDLPAVTRGLFQRGYKSDEVKKILGGNFMRVFEQVWPK
jgi:membrane dipeptidase